MQIGVNLDEVVEKPRLPEAVPLTWQIVVVQQKMGTKPNKTTGQIEPYLNCELHPIDPDWQDRKVYHSWSLSPGALSADTPLISIKKFFATVGFRWNADGTFSTEDLATIRFVATVKWGEKFPELNQILRGA